MICNIIMISKNATLLSSGVIYGIIVISKNIIICPKKGSYISRGNLWHKHNQCKCQSVARGQDVSTYNKIIICTISENAFFQGFSRWQKFPEHYLNNICKYIYHHIPNLGIEWIHHGRKWINMYFLRAKLFKWDISNVQMVIS